MTRVNKRPFDRTVHSSCGIAAAVALLFAAGCGDDIVGDWEYDGSGWDLELEIKEDGEGRLKEDDSGRESRWDVEWKERSSDFKLELTCAS